IKWAVSQGFQEVVIDTAAIAMKENYQSLIEECISLTVTAIAAGKNIIIHTGCGAEEDKMKANKELYDQKGTPQNVISGRTAGLYGTALGKIVRAVAERAPLKRVVVAGGDTSSFAARAMG